MTTLLRTSPANRVLHPVVMTASIVSVPAGTHGPADLPDAVDRAPAHSLDTMGLWAAQPAALGRTA